MGKNEVWEFNKLDKQWHLYILPIYKLNNVDHLGYIWCESTDPTKNGYYVTKDTGKTYQYFESPFDINDCYYYQIETHPNGFYYITTQCSSKNGGFLYRFNDTGVFENLNQFQTVPTLYINQLTGTIFATPNNALFRSTDGGITFDEVDLSSILSISYNSITQMTNGNLLMLADNYYYLSENDGVTWKNYFEFLNGPVDDLVFHLGTFSFVNGSDTIVALNGYCDEQGIYTSFNKGATWKWKNDNFFEPLMLKFLADKNNNLYAKTCSDSSVLFSNDQGENWKKLEIKFGGQSYALQNITEGMGGELFALGNKNLFRSNDGGITYTKLNAQEDIFNGTNYDILTSNNGYIYIVNYKAAYISKDAGNSFQFIPLNNSPLNNWKVDDNGFLYLFDGDNLYIYDPILNKLETIDVSWAYRYEVTKSGIIYLATYYSNLNLSPIMRSIDKMKTYTQIDSINGLAINLISDEKENLYIQTDSTLYTLNHDSNDLEFFSNGPKNNPIHSNNLYISPSQDLYIYRRSSPPKIYLNALKLGQSAYLKGSTYNNENFNCTLDPNESKLGGLLVNIEGQNNFYAYSSFDGEYTSRISEGSYNLSIVPKNSLWEACPPTSLTISQNQTDTINLDLGIKVIELCPYLNLQVQTPITRRCFNNNSYLRYCNDGTSDAIGTKLIVTLNYHMEYITSNITPTNIDGQELTFQLGDLPAGDCGEIVLTYKLSCNSNIGDEICIKGKLTSNSSCNISLQNLSENEKCTNVTGSYDPNDKTAYINGKSADGKSEMNKDIEYLIRFQNTGTDTAFRIVVIDNIPKGFDLKTLKPLNSSHPYSIEIEGRIVKFIFDPIMLPDSNINELASHGFIAFRISPNKDLPYGTKLDNYANIYFDFNEAVVTNTAYLTVTKATNTTNLNNKLVFNYFPNPTKGELNIEVINDNSQSYTLRISDLLGKELIKEAYKGSSYKMNSKTSLLPGIYFINVEGEDGKRGYGKFVVE